MKKKFLNILAYLFLLETVHAQEQSGNIQADISNQISSFELPPVNVDFSLGYQSNIDLLDPNQYIIKYRDNGVINLGGNTKISSEIWDKNLLYSTSLKAIILQDADYDKSSDVLRRVNFNNNLFLNLFSGDDKLSFGPTLDLNAEKRFQHFGWHRKRDNVNGFVGLKSDIKVNSDFMVSSSVAAGYLDHNGNYTNQQLDFFAFEANLQEDRAIYKANITSVLKIQKMITLSLPLSLQRDNFTQRRARAAKTGFKSIEKDLASWSVENNQPYMDETLDLQNFTSGLNLEFAMEFATANFAYTFLDDREMNPGHNRSNADTDFYEMGLSYNFSQLNVAFGYNHENIKYAYLLGGSSEITQTYSTDIKFLNLIKDINTLFKFSYTDYQFSSNYINYAEKAENIIAMIGLTATL